MTFSASPLVPGTGAETDPEAWRRTADLVLAAVSQAAAQIPSAEPLALAEPLPDAEGLQLPTGTALTGYLGAGIEGKVLLVLAADVIEALADTPFGTVEPADALRPALDALAAALGGRLDGAPTAIAVEDCLEVLTGGTTVLVPLVAGEAVHAVVGVSLVAAAPAADIPPVGGAAASSWGIDMLRDVEMEVTCELGRTRMTV